MHNTVTNHADCVSSVIVAGIGKIEVRTAQELTILFLDVVFIDITSQLLVELCHIGNVLKKRAIITG